MTWISGWDAGVSCQRPGRRPRTDPVRHVLTPINLDALALLAPTGWPASVMLRLWAGQVNGLSNAAAENVLYSTEQDHARFNRVTELLDYVDQQELMVVLAEELELQVGGPFPAAAVTGAAGFGAGPAKLIL